MQAGGSQPVEPKDTTPIRAGELATGRAGVEGSRRESKVLKPAQPEDATASESWRVGRWGSRRTQHRLYYEFIKIGTPEASVSGVFNLRQFFRSESQKSVLYWSTASIVL